MKAIQISLLSMMMLFVVAATALAGNHDKIKAKSNTQKDAPEMVRYEVYVSLVNETTLCASYQVILTDQFGNAVAPPQRFDMGKNVYVFYENAPVYGPRIAYLLKGSNRAICSSNNYLYTNPDVVDGPFMSGMSYMFHLYPTTQRPPH